MSCAMGNVTWALSAFLWSGLGKKIFFYGDVLATAVKTTAIPPGMI